MTPGDGGGAANTLFSLRGRIVVVTGGLGLLGRQFADHLTGCGARVAIFDRDASPAAARDDGATLVANVDVTSPTAIRDGLTLVQSRWGCPDGLVNAAALDSRPNASLSDNGHVEEISLASWEEILRVNLTGTFLACQIVGGAMASAGRGVVVNIGSIYGGLSPQHDVYAYRPGFYKPIAYAASKSGLLNLTRYLATYWARRHVRVNTLTLAGVFQAQDPAFLASYCARIPIGRMADSREYNGALHFLLSDASSYVTGANLVVDGGWSAW